MRLARALGMLAATSRTSQLKQRFGQPKALGRSVKPQRRQIWVAAMEIGR